LLRFLAPMLRFAISSSSSNLFFWNTSRESLQLNGPSNYSGAIDEENLVWKRQDYPARLPRWLARKIFFWPISETDALLAFYEWHHLCSGLNASILAGLFYFLFGRIVCVLVTFHQWVHSVMLTMRNLNLISAYLYHKYKEAIKALANEDTLLRTHCCYR